MSNMSDYLKQLELHDDLEAEVIKKTKVHKVLKAIIKLNSIPKEEEYSFKQRSGELLTKWGGALASDGEPAASASAEPATNGVKHDDEKPSKEGSLVAKAQSPAETKEEKKEDTSAEPESATKPADTDGDVTMADADKELNKDAPAIKADTESAVEASTEAATSIETAPTSTEAITS